MSAARENDSLGYALRTIRRRWLILAVAVVSCLAVAAAIKALQHDRYQASSRVLFGTPTLTDAALQVDRSTGDPERDAATNVLLARSEAVAAAVRARLGLSESVSELRGQISVEAEDNANVLRITASDSDPRQAARLANAFADAFIAFRAQSDLQGIASAERDLRAELGQLPTRAPERQALEDSLQRLASLRALATGDARVIARAAVPGAPANASAAQLLVLAAIIGVALGLLGVFLAETLDRRIVDVEGFEEAYALRALTVVPQRAFRAKTMQARSGELEPYRILRAALEFARVTRPFRALLVTSAVQGEGKTTVAVDLAHAIAVGGRPVVLVELDLRRPSLAAHLPLAHSAGVTTALLGRAPVAELVQRPFPELEHFGVLTGGPLPPNPAELLASPALDALLRDLLEDEEVTLVLDALPLLPVADAQVLLNQSAVDGCLVVARERMTTRDEARRAHAILDSHVVVPVGLAVTGHAGGVYGYGYGPAAQSWEAFGGSLEAAPARRAGLVRRLARRG